MQVRDNVAIGSLLACKWPGVGCRPEQILEQSKINVRL